MIYDIRTKKKKICMVQSFNGFSISISFSLAVKLYELITYRFAIPTYNIKTSNK